MDARNGKSDSPFDDLIPFGNICNRKSCQKAKNTVDFNYIELFRDRYRAHKVRVLIAAVIQVSETSHRRAQTHDVHRILIRLWAKMLLPENLVMKRTLGVESYGQRFASIEPWLLRV
jgi:hypothetical protein